MKDKSERKNQKEKTATDNQWVSVSEDQSQMNVSEEKTATDNQWVSTNKNSK